MLGVGLLCGVGLFVVTISFFAYFGVVGWWLLIIGCLRGVVLVGY